MRNIVLAASSLIVLAACASTAPATAPVEVPEAPTESVMSPTEVIASTTPAERAITTALGLVDDRNEQAAIDRLEQALGDPSNTDEDMAMLLLELGKIKMSDRGFDTWGAIADFREIIETYPDSAVITQAQAMFDTANGKATSLNFQKEQPETSRTRKAEIFFELGDHDDAIDLMQGSNLTPNNDILVAMYQIGYLCEDPALSGRTYAMTDIDDTQRALQFCDTGK